MPEHAPRATPRSAFVPGAGASVTGGFLGPARYGIRAGRFAAVPLLPWMPRPSSRRLATTEHHASMIEPRT
jgi:hypothetical protein